MVHQKTTIITKLLRKTICLVVKGNHWTMGKSHIKTSINNQSLITNNIIKLLIHTNIAIELQIILRLKMGEPEMSDKSSQIHIKSHLRIQAKVLEVNYRQRIPNTRIHNLTLMQLSPK
jgi:hypothetical protein